MSDRAVPGTSQPVVVTPGSNDVLVLVDHASNAVPLEMADLGLPRFELERHIGYDVGALEAGRAMAAALGATLIHTTVSRLVIDPNRGEDDPTLVMRLADGAIVPGNARIDDADVRRRIARWYLPYHRAIASFLDAAHAAGDVPAIVAMHSFTPRWKGMPRPWHIGILWDKDPRLAQALIDALTRDPDLAVGDNEPYDGALRGDTLYRHGTVRGLPHALVEVRQDLMADDASARAWGARLAGLLRPILQRPQMRVPMRFGSRTDP